MNPIYFPEATMTLHKPSKMTDEECAPLPIWSDDEITVSCWRPSWRERLSMLFFGKLWLYVHFGRTQPPVALHGTRTIFG